MTARPKRLCLSRHLGPVVAASPATERKNIMPAYTAEFHTNAEWAMLDIIAPTPEAALKKACAVDRDTLNFEPYGDRQPVNYITIRDKKCNDLVEWQDDKLRLEKAAPDLLKALKKARLLLSRHLLGRGPLREIDAVIAKAEGGAA
jgi:hypothetical protein